MLELYKNIKNRRLELGMTQSELAYKMGYADKGMISRIESGKIDLSQTKIKAFADALNTTASSLMGWDSTTLSEKPLSSDEKALLEAYRLLEGGLKTSVLELVLAFADVQKEVNNERGR